jgi:hypothetical protein
VTNVISAKHYESIESKGTLHSKSFTLNKGEKNTILPDGQIVVATVLQINVENKEVYQGTEYESTNQKA